MRSIIPFNRPYVTGNELVNIKRAYQNGNISGTGSYSRQCQNWLERQINVPKALLTHSCSGALEMAILLLDLKPGDEVIMPSYNFVSTANAVALRGAIPVFIDIRSDTLNIDETLIEAAITSKTRAICVVHYAGVSCEMDTILDIAKAHKLYVIEDAAHAIGANYKGRALGGIGDMGTLSFHETKNISCGHGGALLLRNAASVPLAERIHQKGTDRDAFTRGEVDKYTWQTIGSSYGLGELAASVLSAQLISFKDISAARMRIWNTYHAALESSEAAGYIRRPVVPKNCQHNAHIYYVLLSSEYNRAVILEQLRSEGIHAVFHYVPLHSAPAGETLGRTHGEMVVTDDIAARIIRLPLYNDLPIEHVQRITHVLKSVLSRVQA